jgi:RNA polymerase sigma-70 factor (ECF subfamily)
MSSAGGHEDLAVVGTRWFATTHWSVVLAAGQAASPQSTEALERLCRTYWFPLYAYVRRKGYGPEDAQDLTQEFFARFLKRNSLARADRERGRFRTFLLTSLQNFLGHEWERARAEKRGGGLTFVPWVEEGPEGRYQLEENSQLGPDQVFDQRWALALFQHALERLQQESAAGEKGAQFDELKAFLSTEPDEGAYAGAASRLGLSTGAVAVAVHRLRQRYRELVREEVAHTVATPGEVEGELHHLIELMSG